MTESALFTAIPAGREPGSKFLRVTIFVTPKLTPDGGGTEPLLSGAFPLFADWPSAVAGTPFFVDVEAAGTRETFPVAAPVAPDPALWSALFGRTSVGPTPFPHHETKVIRSFPVAEIAAAVAGLYSTSAVEHPTAHPPLTTGPIADTLHAIASPSGPGREPARRGLTRRQAMDDALAPFFAESDPRGEGHKQPGGRFLTIGAVPAGAMRTSAAFGLATRFYSRYDDPAAQAEKAPGDLPQVDPEFHTFVSRLADYPELLRRAGLAIDLLVEDDGAFDGRRTIRVSRKTDGPLRDLIEPEEARPTVLFHRSDRVFTPSSLEDQEDIRDGSLALDSVERFSVLQLDADGAALKVVGVAETAERQRPDLVAHPDSMTPDAVSLPALRTSGISLARLDRAAGLVAGFDKTAADVAATGGGKPAALTARDVTRGWRVDVFDRDAADPDWRSLHRRVGRYSLRDADPAAAETPLADPPGPDEAHVKAASMTATDDDPDQQYLHEVLAGWDGWSLAAKRPGLPQNELGTVPADADRERAATPFPLTAAFRAEPGTLPRLRFGHSYRLRVRAVDLAGSSVPDEQLDPAHEVDLPGPFRRWEPVPSPVVVPRREFAEGESLMRLVIRSNTTTTPAEYVALPRVTGLPGHGPGELPWQATDDRHLAAPLTSQQLAEWHGVFDSALGGGPAEVAAQFLLASRESGSLLAPGPGVRVVNHLDPGAATVLDGTKGQALKEGEYVVHGEDALDLPYLPDVLARGLAFDMLPGETAPTTLRWPGDAADWTDRRPVRLVIQDGTGAPAFDAASRVLTVSLPKAALATVRLSSFFDEADLDLMSVWGLVLDQNPAGLAGLRTLAATGRHWMLTPSAPLTLVHAVEQPLAAPVVAIGPTPPDGVPGAVGSAVTRSPGDLFAVLQGAVRSHSASSGRLDVDAAWTEQVDDLAADAPGTHDRRAHVGDFAVDYDEAEARTGRDEAAGTPASPRVHRLRHDFGDTRHRFVRYRATATTRFREYFPPAITDDPALVTLTGDETVLDVPSSKRPLAPDVRWIVPTWTWTDQPVVVAGGGFGLRRTRSGGGLRVYLGRPWFSSGDDELLGVVLRRQPWITVGVDRGRGLLATVDDVAEADAFAARALAGGAGGAGGRAAAVRERGAAAGAVAARAGDAARLVAALAPAAPPREAAVRATTPAERSLSAVRTALAAAQKTAESGRFAVDDTRLAEFLPLFFSTSVAGRTFTSAWGNDPLYESEPVAEGPFVHQFPLRSAVGTSVTLSAVDGDPVTVVGHTPEFDPVRKLWFCDLQLDAGVSHTPMVRLALVRYQPHSIAGQHISPVVRADFAQLVPERVASYVQVPGSNVFLVSLSGPVGVFEHASRLTSKAARVDASRFVQAWVEELAGDATSDLEWTPVGDVVTLPLTRVGPTLATASLGNRATSGPEGFGTAAWTGRLPVAAASRGARRRIRLVERERLPADAPAGLPFRPLDTRLAFSDTVDLP